ncbi:hypothetical protein THAOC_02205 [Thalassiosira oceanica]|uniref:Uncharacterized protein n=1 Tax=Thalassiosira oceanica TaxID=159749 RepID=K0TG76_THAOC|nr:hypothetical protein THAOC_02205 [Thalassiosira oceanica]|mmetsp:Transcript_13830/g.31722  ORF Transcript_13830/g.31722 Transcript_13830/m.31722 type:complete len:303 (+) Transcript_13830:111-1019(+)|eukprot:EJK76054.1 hypothetical protein THAOC_02205 [Thalassiosira oceanica]
MVQRIAALAAAATLLVAVDSFSPSASSRGVQLQGVCRQQSPSATTALQMAQKMTPTRKTRREDSFDREVPKEEEDEEVILDFSEAQSKLKEDENKRRVEEGLTVGLTKEDEDEFNAKKDDYEDMRAKIRARAAEENIEKSVATAQAIQEATQRAMAGQSSATPDTMLDLSGFAEKLDDGTDELTEEEQAEIDKLLDKSLIEQVQEELTNTRFPTPIAVFQTACVMFLIFAVSATLILKGDVFIRDFYTGLGFIPRPDEVYDFSDLELPDGFLEQVDLESASDVGGQVVEEATKVADSILSSN